MISDVELQCAMKQALSNIDLSQFGEQQSGKVREMLALENTRLIVTTDRISAFDVVLGVIPYKGQVLNQLALWWFNQTADIVPNHVISSPDPNVLVAKEARPLPIEIVVRGYLTGSTKTSLWTLYNAGTRDAYGMTLPEGLRKNDRLPHAIITPTTKAQYGGHDEQITAKQIVERSLVSSQLWAQIQTAALELFARGQQIAEQRGLLLVDTKYEFGIIDGELVLIDELHTPDSSRYWTLESYQKDSSNPYSIDKEFLRLWYKERGYSGEGTPPPMSEDFIVAVAKRYISAYETLTGLEFVPAAQPTARRVSDAIAKYRAAV
ncbi:MAG: phosphoribosylaminoimidazolesuccinocarboxamide synthase [Deinococcales bacterium]